MDFVKRYGELLAQRSNDVQKDVEAENQRHKQAGVVSNGMLALAAKLGFAPDHAGTSGDTVNIKKGGRQLSVKVVGESKYEVNARGGNAPSAISGPVTHDSDQNMMDDAINWMTGYGRHKA